jgi:predicted ATPase
VLDEALLLGVRTGEQHYEAELYRLRGEFLLEQQEKDKKPRGIDVGECFHKALAVARLQRAKSLELRAAMSLARLWDAQGKKDIARQLLAEIYGWFSDGLETADLKEAQLLLEALS